MNAGSAPTTTDDTAPKPATENDSSTLQVEPDRSSADEGVTERVTPSETELVTVPVDALAVLVKLARRFDDDPVIAAALAAVAGDS